MANFPIFNSDGTVEQGQMQTPSGVEVASEASFPYPLPRDPVAEHEAEQAAIDATIAALFPARFAAMKARERAERTVQQWQQACIELRAAVSAATNRLQLAQASNQQGVAGERRSQLLALQAQYDEATEELKAAIEELQAARAQVQSLIDQSRQDATVNL